MDGVLRNRGTTAIPNEIDVDQLVKEYLPLTRQIARRYSRVRPELADDLVQVGCVGLLKAAKAYDPERAGRASFRTFALCFIRGEIKHYLRDHSSLLQMPRRYSEIAPQISRAEEALMQELKHTPTSQEIAVKIGVAEAEVRQALASWEVCTRLESLDGGEESEGREAARAFCELVADRRQIEELSRSEEREVLTQALKKLGTKTREIIEFVYFYDLTQKETAQMLGLSEMKVSRSVRNALKTLKEILFTEIF